MGIKENDTYKYSIPIIEKRLKNTLLCFDVTGDIIRIFTADGMCDILRITPAGDLVVNGLVYRAGLNDYLRVKGCK